MERYLHRIAPRRRAGAPAAPSAATIESLSPEKRALLLQRLRKREDWRR